MWFAIAVTILASSGNNIGKVLQKQATRTLPRLTLRRDIIAQYLRSRLWVTGLLADLAGALLMIVAFAQAPVSVVQPVSAVGLVILLIFSHFYLKERLRAQEWGAASVAFLGVLGLGLSAEAAHLEHPNISAGRVLSAFLLMLGCLVLECWWRHGSSTTSSRPPQHIPLHASNSDAAMGGGNNGRHSDAARHGDAARHVDGGSTSGGLKHPDSHDALLCGLEAGAYFGLSAAATRTGFILAAKLGSWMMVPLSLVMSVMLTSSGFVLQTRGLKTGNTVIVCTMAAVSSMISGVAAGLIALDEKLPTQHHMKVIRFVSWSAILLGVTALAGGAGGLVSVVRALFSCLPPPPAWALRYLPHSLALAMQRASKQRDSDLPNSEDDFEDDLAYIA